jgi:hypothetical protein
MAAPRALPYRIGCPFALAITALVILAVSSARSWLLERGLEAGLFHPIFSAGVAAPFAILALAGARDRLAWTVALLLEAALWSWMLYDLSLGEGANVGLGFLALFVAPLVISGIALATAGVRGRIAWGEDPRS